MADDQIVIQIQLDDGSVQKGFVNIQNNAEKVGKAVQQGLSAGFVDGFSQSVGNATKKLALLATAAFGLNSLKNFLSDSVKQAIESENAINKFNQALSRTGQFTKEFSSSFEEYAKSLQQTTKYSDDAIISNAALLQTIGTLTQSQLKPATKAAIDLASAYGISLEQAFETVGKAAQGQVGALGRLGIEVKKGVNDAETFANALKLIQSRVGGAAGAEVNTYAGAIARAGNAFDDLKESIGKVITENPQVIKLINIIGGAFSNLSNQVRSVDFSKKLSEFIIKTSEFAQAINDLVIRPLIRLKEIGDVVINGIKTAFQGVLSLVADLGVGVGSILRATGLISEDTFKTLTTFADSTKVTLKQFADETVQSFNEVGSNNFADRVSSGLQQVTSDLMNATAATVELKNATNAFIGPMPFSGITTFSEGFNATLDGMTAAMTDFANKSDENFKKVGASMFQTLGNGAANAFAAFGKAIVKGKNALAAFAGALLGTLGQAAVQLGSMFILQGLAYLYAGYPNGPALIAAGAGLAAIGGVLSAIGGEGAGGSTASTTGGGGGGGELATVGSPELNTNTNKPAASTQVIIQGDVLDSDNTGSRIVDLIRQYTDKNGETVLA